MATITQPPTDKELAAIMCQPIVLLDDSYQRLRGWTLKYKSVTTYHWPHCQCDECGAFYRVGIG